MTYVIYGAPGSGSGIIEAACAELGVAHEARDLDARHDEHRGEAFAAINPHRKMPAVRVEGGEVDGEVMTETAAILLTLDERHPEGALLPPPGSPARAQALRWMMFCAGELYPLVELTDYPTRFAPEAADAEALRARADTRLRARWATLEDHVVGPYLLGDTFCATDLFVTKLAAWLDAQWRRERLPRVDALLAEVRARPALQTVWARHIRD